MSNPPLKYCIGLSVLTALFSVCFLTASGFAVLPPLQTIRWETDLNVATVRAEQEQRPLFLHFFGNDSSSAQQMGSDVFAQPNIAAHLNANFVMVRINAIENPALAQRFSVTAVPTDIIMRPNGQTLHRRVGVITAELFTGYLSFLQNDILAGMNQAPTQMSAAPPVAGPFPGPGVSPQGAFQPVPPPAAMPGTMPPGTMPPATMPPGTMPPGTMPPGTMPPGTIPPGAVRDPFALQSPAVQHPPSGQHLPVQHPSVQHLSGVPMQQQQTLQHPSAVTGATAVPASSSHNPLRATETAARPAWEQNTGTTQAPTPPPVAANIQAMLAEPAPAQRTIEVPLALEGFCPVILHTEERWVAGNPAYCTMFQGHVFRFSSRAALVTFAQNPAKYVPVAMGEDIVLKVDRNRRVIGDHRFAAQFQGRVFLFSSQETFNAFERRPDFYAEIALKYELARRGQPMPIVY